MLKKSLSVMLVIIILFGIFNILPFSVAAEEADKTRIGADQRLADVGLESTGYSALDNFINDGRWTNGASWAWNKSPLIASFSSSGCCAYCADYVKYCYGVNNPRSGSAFYSVSEIRAGDVLTVGNQSDGTGHWFVCLKRSGNSLYVAEGNIKDRVRIGWNYTISGNKFAEDSRSFTAGYHYLDGSPYADLGTNFYAFIINSSSWKHLTVEKSLNITIRSEKSHYCADQVFKFEKQSDGSYMIISTANGYCLDVSNASNASGANVGVYQSNDTNAQRWYISGDSGQYTLKAKCTDCVLDVYSGSSDDGANVQMFTSNGSAAQKFQIYKIENRPFAADLGDNFTAPILNTKSWITLENDEDNNLSLQKEVGISRQLWRFKRQSDGSYKIYSCYDGKCIDLYWALHDDGTNISLCDENTNDAQRWYFYYSNDSYVIQSKESGKVLDVYNGNLNYGSNIQSWAWNGTDAQLFSVYRGNECKITAPTLSVDVDRIASNVVFSRNEVYGETGYNLKIWKDTISEGEAYLVIENAEKEATVSLPVGSYQAYVEAYNHYDVKRSNTVSFIVENTALLGDADGDGEVTSVDVTYLQRHCAKVAVNIDEDTLMNADVDGNGLLEITDATYMQRHLAKISTPYPIGEAR